MHNFQRRGILVKVDNAYYGVGTPTTPVLPSSLRARLEGLSLQCSRLGEDGRVRYHVGHDQRTANLKDMVVYIRTLGNEIQRILDLLVKATARDSEQSMKAWQFDAETITQGLEEAEGLPQLRLAWAQAAAQCGTAIRVYRKYRLRVEALLRTASSDPVLASGHSITTLERADPYHPPGLPADGKEAGRGLPAPVLPCEESSSQAISTRGQPSCSAPANRKDSAAVPWEAQPRDESVVAPTVSELQRPSLGRLRSGKAIRATRQMPCIQRTPSEAAPPCTEGGASHMPDQGPRRRCVNETRLSESPSPYRKSLAEAGTHHTPSPRKRKESTAGVRSRQRYSAASSPAPALEVVEDAREVLQTSASLCQESGGGLLEGVRQSGTMVGAETREFGRLRCVLINTLAQEIIARKVPSPPWPSSPAAAPSPSQSPTSRGQQSARTLCMGDDGGRDRDPRACAEIQVSTQEESSALYPPGSKRLQTSISRAQWRHLHCSGPATTTGLIKTVLALPRVAARSSAKVGGRSKTRNEYIAGTHSQRHCPTSSDSAPTLEPAEDAREMLQAMAALRRVSEERLLEGLRQLGAMGGAKTGEW
ncbi:hypothetical protein FB107DRAFT_225184, partial [Schizophyllum commune]